VIDFMNHMLGTCKFWLEKKEKKSCFFVWPIPQLWTWIIMAWDATGTK